MSQDKTVTTPKKILVCGGRDFTDLGAVWAQLDTRHAEIFGGPIQEIIHGDARGADTLAQRWAEHNKVSVRAFPADWHKHGNAAGPIRNRQMLDEAKPDLVIAFPGGKGTANMVAQAKAAGIPVEEINA